MRQSCLCALLVLACLATSVPAPAAEAAASRSALRLGCVAFVKEDTATAYRQLSEYLTKELSSEVALTLYPNYHDAMLDLVNGKLELAVLPPLVYLNARHEKPLETLGYGVYHGSGHFSYRSLILVRADSKAVSLEELSGKKVAFVDIMSASGYVVPKAALVKAGVTGKKDVKGSFHQNHVDAVRALLRGEAEAAATYDLVFSDSREISEQKAKLRTLWTSDLVIPSDAVVAAPEVSVELRGKIVDALLGYYSAQKQKRAAENRVYEGFVPPDPNLYNDLERFLSEFSKH